MATLNTSRTFYFYLSSQSQYLVLYLKVSYLALFNISISQEKSRKTCLAAALIYSNLHTLRIWYWLSCQQLNYSFLQRSRNTSWFLQATIKMGKMSTWMTFWTCYWDIHQVGFFVFIAVSFQLPLKIACQVRFGLYYVKIRQRR